MRSSCAQDAATLDNMRGMLSAGLQKTGVHADNPLLSPEVAPVIARHIPPRQHPFLHQTSKAVRAAMGVTTPAEFRANGHQQPNRTEQILTLLEARCAQYSLHSISIIGVYLDIPYGEYPSRAPRLAAVLRRCPHLTSLNLTGTRITQWPDIAEALPSCPHLEHLDVTHCYLRHYTDHFAPCMSAVTGLTKLNLSGNSLFREGQLHWVTDALPQCTRLHHLDLSSNGLTMAHAALLELVLPQCPSLQHLNLHQNLFGDASAPHIAWALTTCPRLHHLDLSRNIFDIGSAEELAWALPQCLSLRHLNLSDNVLGVAGIRVFGQNNVGRGLTYLDLSYNQIDWLIERSH